ncbi:MAG TPA: hypothetical protein VKA09_16295 [Nitrososphaeraceae archaeon]|nr:hypothetical protein [Nitrososphaeraceae archaeon]
MSNEILPGKLSANRAVTAESPVVMEKKKENKKRRGGLPLFLLAVGLGAGAAGSITLVAPVAFYGHVDSSPGSIGDDTNSRGNGAAVITGALAASATATDGKGTVIENNGLTKSGEMTIAGYSDSSYSTDLNCAIDNLPAYCSGNPITFSGLPPGEHVFTKAESINDQIAVQYFGWDILE